LRWGLANFLPGLASNCSPPYHCHLSTWNYRCEYCAQPPFILNSRKMKAKSYQ
jgi:hypothetical protein